MRIIFIIILISLTCVFFGNCDLSGSKETIRFTSGSFEVMGELRLPQNEDSFPLVIMVHGDGPGYRNSYKTLKQCMLNAGYATLMWDKPGYGKSTGKLSKNNLRQERAQVLIDAINHMKKDHRINKNYIGAWGISQAGYVIPMALLKTDDISFMIMVGCAGENGIRQTAYLIKKQLQSEGLSEEEAEQAQDHFIQLFYATTFEEYIKHAKPLYDNPVQRELGFVSGLWDETNFKPHTPDDEGFFDPMTVMETVTIPALLFFGELDTQVDPVQGMEAYEKAFQKAGNTNYRIELIPNADHNIILSKTGSMKERNKRSSKDWNNYSPGYLRIMNDWLRELRK